MSIYVRGAESIPDQSKFEFRLETGDRYFCQMIGSVSVAMIQLNGLRIHGEKTKLYGALQDYGIDDPVQGFLSVGDNVWIDHERPQEGKLLLGVLKDCVRKS